MNGMTLILTLLAVVRVTRLITSDYLTEPLRVRAIKGLEGHARLQYLLVCSWCASVWVGVAGAAAWFAWGDTRAYTAVCAGLAASYAAGFLASREGE